MPMVRVSNGGTELSLVSLPLFGYITSGTISCNEGDWILFGSQPGDSAVDTFFSQSKVSGATKINSVVGTSNGFAFALFKATSNIVTWNYGSTGGYIIMAIVLRKTS